MIRYVAFLRGINLGKRRIKMDHLRGLFETMKLADVATYIASGNVIFSSTIQDGVNLEKRIEAHLERELGYDVDTFVRTRDEVAAIAAAKPFPDGDMADPNCTVLVILFKNPLDPETARKLTAVRTEVDEFRVIGREVFWLCRIKMSDSRVWKLPAMRLLKLPTSSMRNVKTFRNLAELHPARTERNRVA